MLGFEEIYPFIALFLFHCKIIRYLRFWQINGSLFEVNRKVGLFMALLSTFGWQQKLKEITDSKQRV
jgi:hypothetical protein